MLYIQVTGIANPGKTVSIVVRGSNKLVLEEADRSIHDALCVIRCLVKKRWEPLVIYNDILSVFDNPKIVVFVFGLITENKDKALVTNSDAVHKR